MKRRRRFGVQKVEECGIWLDTEELKRKKVKAHSIAEFLNPLSRSKYNINVAVNFTQTTSPQRCVKQTSVSSFFFPKSKGNPRSHPSASSLQAVDTASPFTATTEEGRLADQPELIIDPDSHGGSFGCHILVDGREVGADTDPDIDTASPRSTAHLNTAVTHEEKAPPLTRHSSHKAAVQNYIDSGVHGLQSRTTGQTAASTEAPILPPDDGTQPDFTQDSQGNKVISHRESAWSAAEIYTPAQGAWSEADPDTLRTEHFRAESLGFLTSTPQTTSRAPGLSERKAVFSPKRPNSDRDKGSPLDNKENMSGPALSGFVGTRKSRPSWSRTLLPLSRLSPQQCANVPRDVPLDFKGLSSDHCELSMLFSQDSQGNRVICHRGVNGRRREGAGPSSQGHKGGNGRPLIPMSPSNRGLCKSPQAEHHASASFSLLFTQDSDGRAVIKHSSRATS
ncbi:aurora kinase A and ninein-interacting protein [Amblyraja radiata]|uniref:aurora kinase A and ninein-interacting protein n=1 Tax=Amblyraja radiata TaxID=386614 RepID=UPI001404237C|nr:aurora kinase A and ninein-interacting protein [Amblyraja radiata]